MQGVFPDGIKKHVFSYHWTAPWRYEQFVIHTQPCHLPGTPLLYQASIGSPSSSVVLGLGLTICCLFILAPGLHQSLQLALAHH